MSIATYVGVKHYTLYKLVNINQNLYVMATVALPNFEELLLKKSLSKVCLEQLCNLQELP
jgi:hypothetical protein